MPNNTCSNIDPAEIKKFDALANEWWEPTGKMRPLHLINPLRLEFIRAQTSLLGKRVIDIGCGGGILTEALAKEGAIVTGVDLSPEVIKIAKQHAEQNALMIDYQLCSAEEMAEKNRQYDIVTCMELLEHVPDPAALIQTCAKLLKPNGYLFFSTINRNLQAFLGAIIAAEYLCRWLPKGTHHYEKFIRPSELILWGSQANLTLHSMQGIRYHPLSQQFSLCRDVSINYLISFTHAI